jgi:hypothetical protein
MPPAGSLKVLRAPARQGEIRRAFQTKIYNLETNEFVSNRPFSKNEFGGSNIAVQFLAGTIRVCLKLILNKKKNHFSTQEHLAKGFLLEVLK